MDLWCQFGAKPALPLKGVGEISLHHVGKVLADFGRVFVRLWPVVGLTDFGPILARVRVFMLLTDFGQTDFGQF